MRKIVTAVSLCFVLIGMIACGGGSSKPVPTPTPTPPPSLAITPNATTVQLGGSQIFTANAVGVTWAMTGPGTLTPQTPPPNSTTSTATYRAPATFPAGAGANQVTISATAGSISGQASASVVYPNNHQSFQSGPIKFGTEGGNVNDVNNAPAPQGGCCVGTLGSLINRGGSLFILSNNHVLDRSSNGVNGEAIDQPGPSLCFGLNKAVGTLVAPAPALKPTAGSDPTGCQGSTAPFCGKSPSGVDAAIAAATTGEVDVTGSILDFGAAGPTSIGDLPPSSTIFNGALTPGLAVAKSGRTSALTCSTIQGVSGDFFVDYDASCGGAKAFSATFNNQIVVNGANFIQAGDSGSLLVTANTAQPMGLLFASGSAGAVANPIQDVITALTVAGPPAVVPQFVGGPDHSISCAPTQSVQSTKVGTGTASALAPQQQQAATSARDRHARPLLTDPAIRSVKAGASADAPGEGAVVIEVTGTPRTSIPATLDGVRTKVVYAQAPAELTRPQVESAIAVKQAHRDAVMSSPGILGIAVGRSDDNPAEPAILIYTRKGVPHPAIAPVIDGVRTKIIESSPFVAQ